MKTKQKKYTALTVFVETVRMVNSRPRQNQSERSDLACHIIIDTIISELANDTWKRDQKYVIIIIIIIINVVVVIIINNDKDKRESKNP